MIPSLLKIWYKFLEMQKNHFHHVEGSQHQSLEMGRSRLIIIAGLFCLVFLVIAGRMVDVTMIRGGSTPHVSHRKVDKIAIRRADIVDRNGVLLATNLPSMSLFAHPKDIKNKEELSEKLHVIFPETSAIEFLKKLKSPLTFVYLHRNLTPKQDYDVNALGVTGLIFEATDKRIYPQANLTSHVVGLTDLDGKGIAGIEKYFDQNLNNRHEALRLSLDVRVQTIMHNELLKTMTDFNAIGAMGIVMDVQTGEIISMISLPDFNPNARSETPPTNLFNRATRGVYEMGSTFKLFNTAAVLDNGVGTINSSYDAAHSIKIGSFEITDYHPEHRWLTMPEILIYSSNIGSARMAIELGGERQKKFFEQVGMLRPVPLELPESGSPLYPNPWREINTMTIAYGHGMAVTPIHIATGVSAIVNGGLYHPATLLYHDENENLPSTRVIKKSTSDALVQMMRMVVTEGTAQKAEVTGYEVAGKTGTAEKNEKGSYNHKALLSSFIATFPATEPRYVILAMLDEPKGIKESFGYATAGWTAAPAVGRIISQIGPLLAVDPQFSSHHQTSPLNHNAFIPASVKNSDHMKDMTYAKAE